MINLDFMAVLSQWPIARALAMQPSVLLCDEITSALDPQRVGEVLQVVKSLFAHF